MSLKKCSWSNPNKTFTGVFKPEVCWYQGSMALSYTYFCQTLMTTFRSLCAGICTPLIKSEKKPGIHPNPKIYIEYMEVWILIQNNHRQIFLSTIFSKIEQLLLPQLQSIRGKLYLIRFKFGLHNSKFVMVFWMYYIVLFFLYELM